MSLQVNCVLNESSELPPQTVGKNLKVYIHATTPELHAVDEHKNGKQMAKVAY